MANIKIMAINKIFYLCFFVMSYFSFIIFNKNTGSIKIYTYIKQKMYYPKRISHIINNNIYNDILQFHLSTIIN